MEDPVALFDALFPSTLVDQIVQQSNLYAAQQVRNLIFFCNFFFSSFFRDDLGRKEDH
jgi:hypothetical protein